MTLNKVKICGMETSELPTLSHDEMQGLMRRAHDGDGDARRALIQANLRLVLSVIQRFHNRGENLDDLFQVGCIGLMKGLDNFDMSMNVRLSTYCVPMIIGEIRRYLRDNNALRVSRSMRDTAYRALRTRDALSGGSREPTLSEIAREMDLPEEEVAQALEAIQDPVSLFDPVYQSNGDAICLVDQLRDDRVSEEDWVRDLSISHALGRLQDRERNIIRQRYFQGRTQMEVAEEIGISQAQVSRLEKAALQQMRKYV